MAKNADRSFRHPLPGGLSLLSMDFTSKGISWADNICQKWGNISVDNILSQKPCKYVGVFGEHFRRMLDEVADDWLNHPDDDSVEGPVSDLSLEHNVISQVCKKSRLGFDDDLNASINGMNHVAHCVEDSNCEISENFDENLGSHCSDADGLSKEEEEEEEEGIVHDIVDLMNMECIEDFEDVNIKDILDDIKTSELVSISQPAFDKVSYKRKFRHAFYSKIISAKKDKDEIDACFTDNDMKKKDMLGNAASEMSSSQNSFEADWEIL